MTGTRSTVTAQSRYRGRFAPSPTGPLHFGSLIAATASYLQAMASGGEWLLRIEDIDPPREAPGAARQIIESLRAHGFRWSGEVTYQSKNVQRFRQVTQHLIDSGHAYHCDCSRQQVRAVAGTGQLGPVYPGTCRPPKESDLDQPTAVRIRTDRRLLVVHDRLQGESPSSLETDVGDFVIRRKDGLIAYALAVAVDDADQGITEVVRGVDLLDHTPAQMYLMDLLGLPAPRYMHVPVAVDAAGQKLSKQTGAAPIDDEIADENLRRCLAFLSQDEPPLRARASLDELWRWAIQNWRPDRLRGCRTKTCTEAGLFLK